MTIKRILTVVLALFCLAGALPLSAEAALVEEKERDGLVYYIRNPYVDIDEYIGFDKAEVIFPAELDGLGVRHIGNPSNMHRASSDPMPEHPEVTRIVIPEGVTVVASLKCKFPNLQEVVLPQSLRAIGQGAFINCPQLKTLTIPSGVALMHYAPRTFDPHIALRGEPYSYAARYAAHNGIFFEPIVYEISRGDLDANGLCNTTDARLILQHTVGNVTVEETFADVDGDGAVTTTDARLCLQYAVGVAGLALEVPATRPSSTLISPSAQVYAELYPLNGDPPRPYGPVADRLGAIRIANAIAANSFELKYELYFGRIYEQYDFVEPDGRTITIRYQYTNDIMFEGALFTGMNRTADLSATV